MTVRVWDLAAHRMKNVRKLTKSARSVTFSPDGRALAIGFKDGEEKSWAVVFCINTVLWNPGITKCQGTRNMCSI